jgi:hypothetical protein
MGLVDLMDLPPELERFVPSWETLFLPLHVTAAETLTRFATAIGWALRVLQAEKTPLPEMERVLAEAMAGLEGLSEERAGQWLRTAWFFALLVLHRRKERDLMDVLLEKARESKFHEKEEVADSEMTLWQQLEAQVRVETEARMRAETEERLRTTLDRILTTRFGPLPPDLGAAVANASIEILDAWIVQAATAPTLEAVGILPGAASTQE